MAWQLQKKNGIKYYQSSLLASLPWLMHGFSTRWQYDDSGCFDFNLGYGQGNQEKVTENRRRFFALFTLKPELVYTVRQVHGDVIIPIEQPKHDDHLQEADGMMTNISGVGLATVHADCVPVLIVDPIRQAIAAVHAGWKGTWAGIVPKTVQQMNKKYGSIPQTCWAAIGPSIGDCCYQVSVDRFRLFHRSQLENNNKGYTLNLAKINYDYLVNLGLQAENIDLASLCTACDNDIFYSYRREQKTGRMLSLVAMK